VKVFFKHFSPASEGPFFIGKDLSLADIMAIPYFYRFVLALKHYRGFSLIPGPERDSEITWAARARIWYAAVLERESVLKTAPPNKNIIAFYEGYANNNIIKDGKWAGRVNNTPPQVMQRLTELQSGRCILRQLGLKHILLPK